MALAEAANLDGVDEIVTVALPDSPTSTPRSTRRRRAPSPRRARPGWC